MDLISQCIKGARAHGAGIRGVGFILRLRFVYPHRFELLRLRHLVLRLLRNSVCVRIIGDALTVCAVAGLA